MPTDGQLGCLARLESSAHVDRFVWHDQCETPRAISGVLAPNDGTDAADAAAGFLANFGELFELSGARELRLISVKEDTAGNRYARFGRTFDEIRVYPSRIRVLVDAAGRVRDVAANWPRLCIERQQQEVDLAAARKIVEAQFGHKIVRLSTEPALEYHVIRDKNGWAAILAWSFVARFSGGDPDSEGFVVSATDGRILKRYPDQDEASTTTTGVGINRVDENAPTPVRTIVVEDGYDNGKLHLLDSSRTPNIKTQDMRGLETSTVGTVYTCADDDNDGAFDDITNVPRTASDRPEVDAHFNTAIVHDYFARSVNVGAPPIALFGRAGWADDPTEDWASLVHWSVDRVWSRFDRTARVTLHGDGDGQDLTYKPTLDVCAHEWTHGLQVAEIQGGVSLNGGFDGTPGENFVIKEATADMIASCINPHGGWRFARTFGDDVAMPEATHASTGGRLRGLQDPAAFGQPDHYYSAADSTGQGFAGAASDYSRIGILDRAAYLMANGGNHPSPGTPQYPPVTVYGFGRVVFENVLYYTLTMLSDPDDEFAKFRDDMVLAVQTLYPGDLCRRQSVERAFEAVGIYETGTTPPPRPPGPDPSITPWGVRLDSAPFYKTEDIFVKDVGGNVVDPLKGQVNRLFARVTNLGDADANGVDVTFFFAPYGAGVSGLAKKTIGSVPVNVPAGMAVEAEVPWDLTDLTDTNGGAWPAPLSDFDHFCVTVEIAFAGDVDPCNNRAQNNFGNVALAGDGDGDGDGVESFLVGNASRQARWIGLIPAHRIPQSWRAGVDLTLLLPKGVSAVNELVAAQDASVPWIPDIPGAVLVPLRAGEVRMVNVAWHVGSRRRYDGPAVGTLVAAVRTGRAPKQEVVARVRSLRWRDEQFEAEVAGTLRGAKTWERVQGLIAGTVDGRSGEFKGELRVTGGQLAEGKSAAFAVKGVMAVIGVFTFVVVSDGAPEGVDLGVPVIGDLGELRRRLRPGPTAPEEHEAEKLP